MKFSNTILGVLLFFTLTLGSKISIISPESLASQFDNSGNEIEFALSHYGNVPYGSHFVGTIIVPHPADACAPVPHFAEDETLEIDNPIAIVRRGGCRVAIKSRNVQFAGAKALIVINTDDDTPEWFGHEHGSEDIKIPALMVNKTDGEKILSYIANQNLKSGDNGVSNIIVSISFTHTKSNEVRLDYWYSAADTYSSSVSFLKQFYEYWSRNNNVIHFYPHVVTWTCAECKENKFKEAAEDCLSGGRYCAPDPDGEGKLTGADVVREDLRQMCTWQQQQKLWWEYVITAGQECFNEGNEDKNCGDRILRQKATPELYAAVEECMTQSYVVPKNEDRPYNEALDDNKVLSDNKDIQIEYAINQFPVLFIEHKPYYGKLHRTSLVFEEVCRNFATWPAECDVALRRTGESTSVDTLPAESHTGRIILFVVLMLLVAIFFIYYCRRMMRKENKDMSLEVGSMVNRYFSINESA